jgi:hypothetical protein
VASRVIPPILVFSGLKSLNHKLSLIFSEDKTMMRLAVTHCIALVPVTERLFVSKLAVWFAASTDSASTSPLYVQSLGPLSF